MCRRLIAAIVLSVITILAGVDLLEDTGLIQYFSAEVDRSLDDAMDDYGQAIRSAGSFSSGSENPHLRVAVYNVPTCEALAACNATDDFKRPRSPDFAAIAVNPQKYSQVLLV